MPDDLAEIRAAAAADQRQHDARRSYRKINDVARRLNCSPSTVRAIAFDDLPFLEIGNGPKKKSRRYRDEDIEAYEAAQIERARMRRAS